MRKLSTSAFLFGRLNLPICRCSGLNVLAFVMIFLFVPETKQRTLEELDYVCASHRDNLSGIF